MIKIDLITGFLGSGKTTFIKKYAKYLMDKGENICIIENDYGAINVDVLLVNEIGCDIEMVSGGCDHDCHIRRFKTKLIAAAMSGHTRVIVEPSGIFDPDEFYDILCEEPLDKWYEIGNVFTIYDFNTKNLSKESEYILVSEAATCGKLIVSKRENNELLNLDYLNNLMKKYKCERIFNNNDIEYDSFYIMDKDISLDKIKENRNILFNDLSYGKIMRIKGFIIENNEWVRINITKAEEEISKIEKGEKVLIIIGENLNKEKIENLF